MTFINHLKRIFSRRPIESANDQIFVEPIEHPILGKLIPDEDLPEVLKGTVNVRANEKIDLHVSAEDENINVALELAVKSIELLEQLDTKCRELIADEFLENYNTTWRFGETAVGNGKFEPFEKPLLTKMQFCMNLKLESLEVYGDSVITFSYGDNDMFWGHTLEATSLDGLAFGKTDASMIG